MTGYTDFAAYYDALTANIDYPARAAYFDRLIRENSEGACLLLDLACGTGSLSLALAARGYDVIGADASGEMLSVAAAKAGESGRRVLFLNQAMDKLDLYGTVDATVCALDSLNHLPDEKALTAAFEKVSLFTNPGGLFIFDVNTARKHREILADNVFVYELDEVYCVWQNSYRGKHDAVDISLDFFIPEKNGLYRRKTERFSERIFSDELLREALEISGFTLLNIYDSDTTGPPRPDSQRLVYVSKKDFQKGNV